LPAAGGSNLNTAAAVLIGFSFGFLVAEIAHRYFKVDRPSFF
jgi:hypothetical protein